MVGRQAAPGTWEVERRGLAAEDLCSAGNCVPPPPRGSRWRPGSELWVGETWNPTFPRAASAAAQHACASLGKVPLTYGTRGAQAASCGKSMQRLSPAPPIAPRSGEPLKRGWAHSVSAKLAFSYFPEPTVSGRDRSTLSCPHWRERCIPVALSIPKCQNNFRNHLS